MISAGTEIGIENDGTPAINGYARLEFFQTLKHKSN